MHVAIYVFNFTKFEPSHNITVQNTIKLYRYFCPFQSSEGHIPSCKCLKLQARIEWNVFIVLGPCNVSQTMPMNICLSLVVASDSRLDQEYTQAVLLHILPSPVMGTPSPCIAKGNVLWRSTKAGCQDD